MGKKTKEEVKSVPEIQQEEQEPEQLDLYGKQDFVFNVLHTQLSDVIKQKDSCRSTIRKKETEIKILEKEEVRIRKAIVIVKEERDKAAPGKKEEEKK